MVLHLLRHRLAGDRVPFRAFWGIYRERNEA